MTVPARFSKSTLLDALRARCDRLNTRGFDRRIGWNQVDGEGEEANREYGAWNELADIIDLIEEGALP